MDQSFYELEQSILSLIIGAELMKIRVENVRNSQCFY